jgi:hypothetical protein
VSQYFAGGDSEYAFSFHTPDKLDLLDPTEAPAPSIHPPIVATSQTPFRAKRKKYRNNRNSEPDQNPAVKRAIAF